MVKNERTSFTFHDYSWDRIVALTMQTQKSRSATLGMAIDYFCNMVKGVSVPRDERVESARKILVYDSLLSYIENTFYKNTKSLHHISCRWETETVDALSLISKCLSVSIATAINLAVYAYWESFHKDEAQAVHERLERIIAILKE